MELAEKFKHRKNTKGRHLGYRVAAAILLLSPAYWASLAFHDFHLFSDSMQALQTAQTNFVSGTASVPQGEFPKQALILSGRHALHLYHAWLGSRELVTSGKVCAYDPAFHAGYLKTPLFDSVARPLETFLLAFSPLHPLGMATAARVQGGLVFLIILSTPYCVYLSGRWSGMPRGASLAAGILVLVVMCLTVWRDCLILGDMDRLAGAPLVMMHLGLLLHYHRHPSVGAVIGMTFITGLCWLFDPLLTIVCMPVQLWIYLRTGMKHGASWHMGLLFSGIIGIVFNGSYLIAWQKYWWIRVPPKWEVGLFPCGILQTLLADSAWGERWEQGLGILILALGMLGNLLVRYSGRRLQAAALSMALGGIILLYGLGQAIVDIGRLGTASLLPAALMLSCLPAASFLTGLPYRGRKRAIGHLSSELLCDDSRLGWECRIPAVLSLTLVTGLALFFPTLVPEIIFRFSSFPHLTSNLEPGEESFLRSLRSLDPSDGRILWEMHDSDEHCNWAVLVPTWTGHSLVGGLDSTPRIEHMQSGLFDGRLAGRPLEDWSPESFLAYCRTYQVAWVAVRNENSKAWLRTVPGISIVFSPGERDTGPCLMRIPGSSQSIALVGSARIISADTGQIILADVIPSRGLVVLSLHYQTGLVASPGRVEVERELDFRDPIPLIRLRMDEPATRLQLRWLPP